MPSFEIEIRDETARRLEALSRYGSPARVRKSFILPTQDSEVPCALVYFGGVSMTTDGDANAGAPSFVHSVRLVVSCLVKANDPEELELELDDAANEVLETLLTDPSWLELIDSVPQIDRNYKLHDENKRLLMAEARMIFTINYSSDWEPRVPDRFATGRIRTGDTPGDINAELNLPQS
ncbi:hypothetical protein OSH11_17155 [Kaistia dalseonensis]|uniref:Tail terminator n=1 Tax=Kaistia dalseonensis TaxID=410840 RepID=A0ABU0H9R4_9HYPH|nr:hypothetical protein [Kaistia dalseonensis]MCX5496438.1 hypothetical protein [Kaistia dalseonensis]MDQ0439059.1 hypothetical protein [Kaistia dalseonensis]